MTGLCQPRSRQRLRLAGGAANLRARCRLTLGRLLKRSLVQTGQRMSGGALDNPALASTTATPRRLALKPARPTITPVPLKMLMIGIPKMNRKLGAEARGQFSENSPLAFPCSLGEEPCTDRGFFCAGSASTHTARRRRGPLARRCGRETRWSARK